MERLLKMFWFLDPLLSFTATRNAFADDDDSGGGGDDKDKGGDDKAGDVADDADKGGDETNPNEAGSDEWYSFEAEKRGAKNILKENEKTRAELADSKKKIQEYEDKLKSGETTREDKGAIVEEIENYKKAAKSEGMSDAMIQANLRMMGIVSSETTNKKLSPFQENLYSPDLDFAVKELKGDKKFAFAVEKLDKQFRERMKEDSAPQHWKNPRVYRKILGEVYLENRHLFKGKDGMEILDEVITETGKGGGTGGGAGGVNQKEFADYCKERGMSTATPLLKKGAIDSYNAFKKMEKARIEANKK